MKSKLMVFGIKKNAKSYFLYQKSKNYPECVFEACVDKALFGRCLKLKDSNINI
jgi:hypothetical protein